MSDLKTLKDLRFFGKEFRQYHEIRDSDEEWIRNQLKAEAVKWVKLCLENPVIDEYGLTFRNIYGNIETSFTEFFNLTKEDLKEQSLTEKEDLPVTICPLKREVGE